MDAVVGAPLVLLLPVHSWRKGRTRGVPAQSSTVIVARNRQPIPPLSGGRLRTTITDHDFLRSFLSLSCRQQGEDAMSGASGTSRAATGARAPRPTACPPGTCSSRTTTPARRSPLRWPPARCSCSGEPKAECGTYRMRSAERGMRKKFRATSAECRMLGRRKIRTRKAAVSDRRLDARPRHLGNRTVLKALV